MNLPVDRLHPVLLKPANRPSDTYGDVLKYVTGGYWIDSNHWLHGPQVSQRPIPEGTLPVGKGGQPIIEPRNAILHTNAGSKGAASLWGFITNASVSGEPHFQAGYGTLEQYMPLNRRADCNYSANRWRDGTTGKYFGAISFETQDDGSASLNTTPWKFSKEGVSQWSSLVNALTCLGVVYGLSCAAPTRWDAPGIGHHVLYPFQGVGRSAWTNVRGKTCPGAARIKQMDSIRAGVAERLAQFAENTGFKCGRGVVV